MSNLDAQEETQLVDYLKKLEPGFLPYDVFIQVARLVTLPIIEFVPLRINDRGEVEVLLLHRGDDDPIWSGELHTPGTVIRATDTEGKMYLAFERILKDELGGVKTSSPHYVGSILHKSKRGTEQSQVFWIEVLEENPPIGEFYPANDLPKKIISSQIKFINQAVLSYTNSKAA